MYISVSRTAIYIKWENLEAESYLMDNRTEKDC